MSTWAAIFRPAQEARTRETKMEIKGEQIQNRYKYSSMMRIINMQKKLAWPARIWGKNIEFFLMGCAVCLFFSQVVEACAAE